MAIGLCDRSIPEKEVISQQSLVISYWLLVIGYWLLVICCQFQCPVRAFFPMPNSPCPVCPIPNALSPMPNSPFPVCPIQILDAGAVEKFLNCFIF
jgi:hypothetical protein